MKRNRARARGVWLVAALILASCLCPGAAAADEVSATGRLTQTYDRDGLTYYVLETGAGTYHLFTDAGDLEPDYKLLDVLRGAMDGKKSVTVGGERGSKDGRTFIQVKTVTSK